MKFKLIKKANPLNRKEVKLYAYPIHMGKKDLNTIAEHVSHHSALSRGDVLSALQCFVDILPSYLKDGYSVQLGGLCTMRLTLTSEGVMTEEEFNYRTIKSRVVMVVGKTVKNELLTTHYHR